MRKTLGAVFAMLLIGALNVVGAPTTQAADLPDFPMALPVGWGTTVQASGTHTFSSGVRSSVDLGASGGVSVPVVAAADGVISTVKANCQVVITHSGGWQTRYYHLKSIPSFAVGKKVTAGTKLGMTAMPGSETCGRGTFRHVHFSLMKNGVEVPINGLSLGGYTVSSTGGAYCGYWTRDSSGAVVADARRSCYAVPKLVNNLIHPDDLQHSDDTTSRDEERPEIADKDTISADLLYITEGQHTVGGRAWRTTCEPYSSLTRCQTDIWATTVVSEGSRHTRKEAWAFNNLTYTPSPRSVWATNPLGNAPSGTKVEWVAEGGRKWYTECDTPATGKGACRAYIWATAISAEPKASGGYTFVSRTGWTFNNIVRFSD